MVNKIDFTNRLKIILENQVFTMQKQLKIAQGFKTWTFQLNFGLLK